MPRDRKRKTTHAPLEKGLAYDNDAEGRLIKKTERRQEIRAKRAAASAGFDGDANAGASAGAAGAEEEEDAGPFMSRKMSRKIMQQAEEQRAEHAREEAKADGG